MKHNLLIKSAFAAVLLASAVTMSAQVEVISNGKVGIGTLNPQKKLEIWDGTSARFTFSGSSATSGYEVAQTMDNTGYKINVGSSARNFKVAIGGVDKFKILAGENYAFGENSLRSRTSGEHNIGFGYDALYNNNTGSYNLGIGREALYANKGGAYNVALGFKALYLNTTGSNNIALGLKSLRGNTEGYYNIALGNEALFTNSTGNYNIAIGSLALHKNNGGFNIAIGSGSLYSNTSGSFNVATGYQALYKNTANNNTAYGAYALYSNTIGSGNTATGHEALYYNDGGKYNTANGTHALYDNNGNYNTAMGYYALYKNVSGNDNVAIGDFTLRENMWGGGNTAVGSYALAYNETGSGNTAIGSGAGVGDYNLWNTTAIGRGAIANASDQVVIGNNNVISIVGPNNFTIMSDGRTKKNIRAEVPGLSFVNLLQPVMYNFDLNAMDELQKSDEPKINALRDSIRNARSSREKEMVAKSRAKKEKVVYSGFIAQDVEKAAQSVGYDFSGVDAPENGKGAYGLRYAEFVVPLVKAVQELSGQNDRLLETLKEQQVIIEELKEKVGKLEGKTPVISLRSYTEENETSDLRDAVIAQCKLYQNTPNPFNQDTQIKYFIPENVGVAQLCIYNLQGTQIKQILITQRGEGSQWISGSELVAGIYLYALIVDGKEVDTKRMILTK